MLKIRILLLTAIAVGCTPHSSSTSYLKENEDYHFVMLKIPKNKNNIHSFYEKNGIEDSSSTTPNYSTSDLKILRNSSSIDIDFNKLKLKIGETISFSGKKTRDLILSEGFNNYLINKNLSILPTNTNGVLWEIKAYIGQYIICNEMSTKITVNTVQIESMECEKYMQIKGEMLKGFIVKNTAFCHTIDKDSYPDTTIITLRTCT